MTVTDDDKNYLWNFNKGSGDEIKKIPQQQNYLRQQLINKASAFHC